MRAFLPIRSLTNMQREAALKKEFAEVRRLLNDGYAVDADRALDELVERWRGWLEEANRAA